MYECSVCCKYIYLSICFHNSNWYHTESCCFICKGESSARKALECFNCRQMLSENKNYKRVNDKAYCLNCYSESYCNTCEKCSKKIKPNEVELTFDNKPYHADCFYCCGCFRSLDNEIDIEFYKDKNDDPICLACYSKKYPKTCFSCLQKVDSTKSGILFFENFFHKQCFSCSKCEISLLTISGDKLKVFKGNNDLPLCEPCYETNNCRPCNKCDELVGLEQPGILFDNKVFHKNTCFCCFICNTNLMEEGPNEDGKFYKANFQPFCMNCYAKYCCSFCQHCQKAIMPNMKYYTHEMNDYHEACFEELGLLKSRNIIKVEDSYIETHEITTLTAILTRVSKQILNEKEKDHDDEEDKENNEDDNIEFSRIEIIKSKQKEIKGKTKMCTNCKCDLQNIGESLLKRNNDEDFCIECYRKLFGKPCKTCNLGVLSDDTNINFNENLYHETCLKCYQCKINIGTKANNEFRADENRPYCIECYDNTFGKKCNKCSQIIKIDQPSTSFHNKDYHEKCFGCSNCNSHLKANDINSFKEESGKVFCIECYRNLFAKPCQSCSKGILSDEPMVYFEERLYHKTCLSCDYCSKKILTNNDKIKADNIIYFKNENNYPICQECYEGKYCKSCDKCEKRIVTNQSSVLYEDKNYHAGCFACSKCGNKMLPDVEKLSKDEKGKLLCQKCTKENEKLQPKAKAGPGKLNFNKIGTFEKTAEIKCKSCRKNIEGQKYLSNMVGQFYCKECYLKKNETLCFMCKKSFESGEEFFKDDTDNNYCDKCIKIYQKSKKETNKPDTS